MLILPLHKRPSREQLPVITLVLVLINVAVFVFLQGGDRKIEMEAADSYIDSGVLEQEWRWFAEWIDYTGRTEPDPEAIDGMFGPVGDDRQGDYFRLMIIESEPDFHHDLENGLVIDTDTEDFARWQTARDRLEADRGRSFTRRHMLRYDEINAVTSITHMFMHGGLAHLIGNMLFLILLGVLVEPALGAGRFLAAYLVAGLAAVVASLSVHWGTDGGGIGASGAIAGLMGLFAVIYGTRKVRFFYWAFVYFDYVRAPALVLLPMWLGWEIFSFLIDDGGNIAYEAHIGGLVCGALLGLAATRTDQVREAYIEDQVEDEDLEADRRAIARAQAALDALDAVAAKRHLRPLLVRHGDDARLLQLYFAACQLRKDDPQLDDAARRVFRLVGDNPAERELLIDTYQRYRQARGGALKITIATAVGLAAKFVRWGELEAAADLVDRLLRSRRPVPGLAEVCHDLAAGLQAAEAEPDKADRYRKAAETLPG